MLALAQEQQAAREWGEAPSEASFDLIQVAEAMGAGCAVLLSQALSYPTPRHDPAARLPRKEEEEALYTNRWRRQLGDRIRLGLNAPLPLVAARRSAAWQEALPITCAARRDTTP